MLKSEQEPVKLFLISLKNCLKIKLFQENNSSLEILILTLQGIRWITQQYVKLDLTLLTLEDDAQWQKVSESQSSSSYFLQKTITVLMESSVKTGRTQIGKYLHMRNPTVYKY